MANKKICWYVDLTDNYKGFVGVFKDSEDKEKVAKALGDELSAMEFDNAYEIGKNLADSGYAQSGDYEFCVEYIKEIKI